MHLFEIAVLDWPANWPLKNMSELLINGRSYYKKDAPTDMISRLWALLNAQKNF